MQILQVTPRYIPHTGGVETHVQKICEQLVGRGHSVTVHTADAGTDVETQETHNGVEIVRHRGIAPNNAFHIAPSIALAIRRANADIVHTHNYHSFPVFFAALGVTNERFIVTPHYHGMSTNNFRDYLLTLYRPIGRWALDQADAVVAVSEWEYDELREDFGVDATVIPNGLDVQCFAQADPVERKRPYLLTVGRLEEYKGIQHLIRTMPELPEYDLLVAGSGPYHAELEHIAREEGVFDRVEFLGYTDHKRLVGLYAGAEVYVTMSEFEAYGMTVAEALAARTPCVVFESGALGDWTVCDGCVGVASQNSSTVSDAIEQARGLSPNPDLPTWADITYMLERLYRSRCSS